MLWNKVNKGINAFVSALVAALFLLVGIYIVGAAICPTAQNDRQQVDD